MDENIVKNVLNVIKASNDKSVIYKALVKLRTDLVKDRDGIALFRLAGGIPLVIRLLNRPHEKILEVALSILANCCTDRECCREVVEHKIASPLITILKSIPNPVVQCRACRLLGNLAREDLEPLKAYSKALSQALCLILEETSEIATTVMAARAARILATDKQFLRDFVKCSLFKYLIKILIKQTKNADESNNMDCTEDVKPVGRKSSQPREKYFEEVARNLEGVRSDIFDYEMLKKDRKMRISQFSTPTDKAVIDLISEILRCVQTFSELQSYAPVIELYGESLGFPCLASFVNESDQFRSIALKILSNLSNNPTAIPVLSAADAVTAACDLLTASNLEKPLTDSETKHCLNIICLLAADACNRAKIRRSGALNHLIQKAKVSKSCSEISLILFTLNNFQYDQLSMDLLLRGGLVGILVKELDAYLNSNDKYRKGKCEEKKRSSKKRKLEINSPTTCKNPKIWADLFEPESPTSPNSSQATSSLSPSSPCSSRSLSPVSMCSKNFNDNDKDSDIYSPVCSDDEEEPSTEEKKKQIDDCDVMKLLEQCCKAEESNIEENDALDKEDDKETEKEDEEMPEDPPTYKKPSFISSLPSSIIDIIDNLLMKISLQLKNRGELIKPDTLKTIIQAINVFGVHSNGFGTSLSNIISSSEFFVPILKQDVVYQIYRMTKNEELKQGGDSLIDTLTFVAESGYGRGELTRLLMKGESLFQKRAAIAVAFVVRTPKILHPLLTENGGLYILLNSILNKDEEVRFEAAEGLTSLSQALGITLPYSDLKQFDTDREFDEHSDFPVCQEDSEDTMKFVLHRGCSKIPIKFNKKLLTENSEVFNLMLNSDFRESNEREVHLKDTSVNGIKYFLNLMNLVSKDEKPNIPPIYHFDSILEAYELSRMYILENLEKELFNLITQRISEETSLMVFEWALKHFNPELSEIAINYYLCSDLSGMQKVDLFRKADYSEYSKEWNQMIIDAILVKCQNIALESN